MPVTDTVVFHQDKTTYVVKFSLKKKKKKSIWVKKLWGKQQQQQQHKCWQLLPKHTTVRSKKTSEAINCYLQGKFTH